LKQKVAVYPPHRHKVSFSVFLSAVFSFLFCFKKKKGNSPCALHFIDLLESLVVEGRHLPVTLFFSRRMAERRACVTIATGLVHSLIG
jgi:hypothetical protein